MDTPDTHTPPSTPGSEPRTSYLEEKAFKARTLLVFGTITLKPAVTPSPTALPEGLADQ